MATWSLTSSASGVSANDGQIVLARLAITTSALAASGTYAWPYTLQLPLGDGDVTTLLYFDNAETDPQLPGP